MARLELGIRQPRLRHLRALCYALKLPLQWFINGSTRPGASLQEIAVELQGVGVTDLWVGDAVVPGAFRPVEQLVTGFLSEPNPNARILEALPAVLAWNRWDPRLFRAYARVGGRRVLQRLGWLADVTAIIHQHYGFPGGCVRPRRLAWLVRNIPKPKTEDGLGHAADGQTLPPAWKRWKITYPASLEDFRARAESLAHDRAGWGIDLNARGAGNEP